MKWKNYKNNNPRALLIASAILFTVFLVISITALLFVQRTRSFIASAVTVKGTVTELVHRGRGYAPTFVFTDTSGNEHTIRSNLSTSPPVAQVGETVDVLYDPADVSGAEIRGIGLYVIPLVLSIFAGVTGLLSVVFFVISGIKFLARPRTAASVP